MNKYLLFISLILATLLASCKDDKSEPEVDSDPNSIFTAALINTDAASEGIMDIITINGDTISYYGNKNSDGTTKEINTIEYTTKEGILNTIQFDNIGRLASIASNNGAEITFEWLTATKAVINAHSQTDNIFISTEIDFASPTAFSSNTPSMSSRAAYNCQRDGEFSLKIIPEIEFVAEDAHRIFSRAKYDPDNYPSSQEVHLWINQCGSNYNAQNYLLLKNASNGLTIGKLTNYEKIYKGNYIYKLPLSSYPSSATNAEFCANIDEALRNIENFLGGALFDSAALVTALNAAAVMTGVGVIPAIITDAVVFAATAFDCSLQILNENGGISALMKWRNSEWYYKEYINSDIIIIPVGFTNSKTIMGDPHQVNPNDQSIFVTLDMIGNPVIDSFTLNPSHPGRGVSYTATAEYHCIPDGSTIELSIIGTDGYQKSISQSISNSGSAVLTVPGAETGVYDLCTAVIKMPFGESITMQASLVFGN